MIYINSQNEKKLLEATPNSTKNWVRASIYYNDKLKVYNKSKELLENSDKKIELPFIDKKNNKEYFIIKVKK